MARSAFFVIWTDIARDCDPWQTDCPTKRRHLTIIIYAERTRAWIALLLTSFFKCSSVCSLPDIIRNKCSALRQRGADLVADNGVALARDVFEPLAVRYNDPAPTIFNDARLCELTSHQIHRRPPDPEHLRKKFLGQRKDVSVDPIPGLDEIVISQGDPADSVFYIPDRQGEASFRSKARKPL